MANELPYFRFTSQAWQNGLISLESYELKGLFIDICAYYWVQDCTVTLTMLNKKYSNAKKLIEQLIELGIIKHENRHDKVEIEFLNNQYDLLSEKRKRRQGAGSKGGKAKAMLKQKSGYKDKDNNKDKDKDNKNKKELVFPYDSETFMNTWEMLKASKKWKGKSFGALQASLLKLSKHTEQTAIQAMLNAIAGEYQGVFPESVAKTDSNTPLTNKYTANDAAAQEILIKLQNEGNHD